MTDDSRSVAKQLGAQAIGQVPDTGGGAFGAARLAKCIDTLLLEGLASGELIPVTQEYWEEKKRRLIDTSRATEGIRQGLEDMKTGRTQPIDEVFSDICNDIGLSQDR